MSNINFENKLFVDFFNREEFLRMLGVASDALSEKISIIPFSSKTDPENYFNNIIRNRYVDNIRNCGDGIQLYKLTHKIKGDNSREECGFFFIYKHNLFKNIYWAVSLEKTHFIHKELREFFYGLYPDFLFPLIKSNMMEKLIREYISTNNLSNVEIKRASQQFRYKGKSGSRLEWLEFNLDEAFSLMRENDGWFKSLQFNALKHDKVISKIYFDRMGCIIVKRGIYNAIKSFVEPVCKSLYESINLYSNRSRRKIKDFKPKPLTIEYDNEIFENVSTNHKFIESLRKYKKSSLSVIHGNPYVHVSLTDYIDGSSFDVWVIKNNQIIIVPQMKGTTAGIKRLTSHIFNFFAEGEVRDYL